MPAQKGGNSGSFGSKQRGKVRGPGAPKLTEEQKWKLRMQRAVEYDYKAHCRALLPVATDQLAQRLDRGKMSDGDVMRAQELLRDTVHGRPAQVVSAPDGGPLVGTFVAMLATVDGAKVEKLIPPAPAALTNGHANGNGSGNGHAHEKL